MGSGRARIIDKPWGHEEIFAETASYVGKILFIRQGEALSLQYHEVKEETLRVLDGTLELSLGTDPDHLETHHLASGAVSGIRPP